MGRKKERFGQNPPFWAKWVWATTLSHGFRQNISTEIQKKCKKNPKTSRKDFVSMGKISLLKQQHLIMTFNSKWQWDSLHTKMYSRSMDAEKHPNLTCSASVYSIFGDIFLTAQNPVLTMSKKLYLSAMRAPRFYFQVWNSLLLLLHPRAEHTVTFCAGNFP